MEKPSSIATCSMEQQRNPFVVASVRTQPYLSRFKSYCDSKHVCLSVPAGTAKVSKWEK